MRSLWYFFFFESNVWEIYQWDPFFHFRYCLNVSYVSCSCVFTCIINLLTLKRDDIHTTILSRIRLNHLLKTIGGLHASWNNPESHYDTAKYEAFCFLWRSRRSGRHRYWYPCCEFLGMVRNLDDRKIEKVFRFWVLGCVFVKIPISGKKVEKSRQLIGQI